MSWCLGQAGSTVMRMCTGVRWTNNALHSTGLRHHCLCAHPPHHLLCCQWTWVDHPYLCFSCVALNVTWTTKGNQVNEMALVTSHCHLISFLSLITSLLWSLFLLDFIRWPHGWLRVLEVSGRPQPLDFWLDCTRRESCHDPCVPYVPHLRWAGRSHLQNIHFTNFAGASNHTRLCA